MELLKKNLGLLIFSLVCLILGLGILWKTKTSIDVVTEKSEEITSMVDYIKQVKRKEYSLNEENIERMEKNRDIIDQNFINLRTELSNQYSIAVISPTTSIEALENIERELRKLESTVKSNNLLITDNYFSFGNHTKTLPKTADIPKIQRNIEIVKEVVRLVTESNVNELTQIKRPMGLEVITEDLYTVTPIRIKVIGSMENIQKLINDFQLNSKYLFAVRRVELASPDQVAPLVTAAAGQKDSGTSGGRQPSRMGMEMGMEPGMGPGRGGPGGFQPQATQTSTQSGMTQYLRTGLLVFKDRVYNADIRFDLIEFIKPSEEEE